ncbi:hypothetical protein [Sphingomonas sp. 10B4]|uniref:hypothetical protein n=1 Tax=Sphingomonas sp. 10B4 TaxID=3048575 RepID=UPI002AB54F27|nr:hypothetical protein [Sphingomonas sp. 10B4]MDY7525518.1 hypothetical protein [Sphingomonas sp. 10B4]MEB0281464.1 hypothetical protein [Sphingomonas sp. 10B4]
MARAKPTITKARYEVVVAFDYLTAGRQYDVETRSNSRDADFRRADGSGIGCYVPTWALKRAIADGSVVQVAA